MQISIYPQNDAAIMRIRNIKPCVDIENVTYRIYAANNQKTVREHVKCIESILGQYLDAVDHNKEAYYSIQIDWQNDIDDVELLVGKEIERIKDRKSKYNSVRDSEMYHYYNRCICSAKEEIINSKIQILLKLGWVEVSSKRRESWELSNTSGRHLTKVYEKRIKTSSDDIYEDSALLEIQNAFDTNYLGERCKCYRWNVHGLINDAHFSEYESACPCGQC